MIGPDHYVPFIVMSKAGNWSISKTIVITIMCGIGHVLSSIVIGAIGIVFGIAVLHLETVESLRGEIAGWLLVGFGLAYTAWGMKKAIRNTPHHHHHQHGSEMPHTHEHTHETEHIHVHPKDSPSITPWILFTIFVFGPCEALIPVLMYPAARGTVGQILAVTTVFAIATIGTMLIIVVGSILGLSLIPSKKLERYAHALAGISILLCGVAVQFLDL